ncbi:hypothetical protein JST97_17805 [bacterium]|nr:hypothetical protein [bacterium]
MELTSLSHCLDPDGVIIAVSDTYKPFAFANGGRLNGGEVLGRPLLSFVQGEALKGFLADFLEGSRALPGRLPYRCDSPRELRFWEVEAHSEDTGLWVTYTQVESCPRLSKNRKCAPLARPVQLCSWCNGVMDGARLRWLYSEEAEQLAGMLIFSPSVVSHTLCPLCTLAFQNLRSADAFAHLRRLEVHSNPIVRLTPLVRGEQGRAASQTS